MCVCDVFAERSAAFGYKKTDDAVLALKSHAILWFPARY
jgi:hypothetical protein